MTTPQTAGADDPARPVGLGPLRLTASAGRTGVALAALALAASSTGAIVVPGVLLGIACWSRRSTVAFVASLASVVVRFRVESLDDYASLQSVLGPAGVVGPPLAAASAWLAAVAVLLGAVPADDDRVNTYLIAAAAGTVSALIVTGAGPGGALELRIGVSVGAGLLSVVAARWRSRTVLTVRGVAALGCGLGALVAAGWPA